MDGNVFFDTKEATKAENIDERKFKSFQEFISWLLSNKILKFLKSAQSFKKLSNSQITLIIGQDCAFTRAKLKSRVNFEDQKAKNHTVLVYLTVL